MIHEPDEVAGVCEMRFAPGPLLREVAELQQPALRREHARRLANARVIMADYRLIQHDFPALRPDALLRQQPWLGLLPATARTQVQRRLIDRWLLWHGALMSEAQVAQEVVNSPIPAGRVRVPVFRPPMYGRAFVASLSQVGRGRADPWPAQDGLLDLKGTGVRPSARPSTAVHSNGLLPLGPALAHVIHQELIERVFEHSGSPFRTLPNYAVLSTGFQVRFRDGSLSPACIQVRRAHRRMRGGGDLPDTDSVEHRVKLEVELLLRQYGITSCTAGTGVHFRRAGARLEVSVGHDNWTPLTAEEERGLALLPGYDPAFDQYHGVNVQTTLEVGGQDRATLVDFGQYTVPGHFDRPILSLVNNRPIRWGLAISPSDPCWIEPQHGLVPDAEVWGPGSHHYREGTPRHPRGDTWTIPYQTCFELATQWERGAMSSVDLRAELSAMVAAGTRGWPARGAATAARSSASGRLPARRLDQRRSYWYNSDARSL